MNNNINETILTEFFNDFNYQEKNNYNWKILYSNPKGENKRKVYGGEDKDDKNNYLVVKQIEICNEEFNTILKEIYFLIILKNIKFFVQLDDFLFLNNKKIIYLLFKGNCINLKQLIRNKIYDYRNDIKYIIYQITFGLYILHSNDIIHNDIKLTNILINRFREIQICDLGSATKKENSNEYSKIYSPPEFLNGGKTRDEKSDMWSLGVSIIELFLGKNIFFNENEDANEKTILSRILSKFGLNDDFSKDQINILIKDNNTKNLLIFENEEKAKINDEEALELINNLVVLNPNHRFTAKEALLKSKYLKEYLGENSLNIKKLENNLDYNTLLNVKTEKDFMINYKILHSNLKNK